MSNDWKKQLAELSKNEEFQEKQKEIAEKFKDNEAAMKEEIVKLLMEYGITAPEEGFNAPAKELSDDELGAVAGGNFLCIMTECACAVAGYGIAGDGGPTLCVCPLAGGGASSYINEQEGRNPGGCGCFLGGYGSVEWQYE